MEKVISLYKAGTLIASYKERGKKSGIAVGTFNPVRPHHANALEEAKEFLQRHANGGILIVATNDKNSLPLYRKGNGYIMFDEAYRVGKLCELPYVDFVVTFPEMNAATLLRYLRPDYMFKGGDYAKKPVAEEEVQVLKDLGIGLELTRLYPKDDRPIQYFLEEQRRWLDGK